jgi:futalosine hydrolase
MRILLVAATEFEVLSLKSKVGTKGPRTLDLELLTTGVGMVATAFALGRHLALNKYDLAINLGIAGSFDRDITLGEVVEIIEDNLSELGAEDAEEFLTIESMGFGESKFMPTAALSEYGNFDLKKCTAITVNTVHGHQPSIKKLTSRLQPQLESMEGAAFFYACKQAGVPCLQIRAVSNYVGKRNRDAWQIGPAVKNLNSFAGELLKRLDV